MQTETETMRGGDRAWERVEYSRRGAKDASG